MSSEYFLKPLVALLETRKMLSWAFERCFSGPLQEAGI
jgi:hypothetical protein